MTTLTLHWQPTSSLRWLVATFLLISVHVLSSSSADGQLTNEQKSSLDRIATQDVPKGAPGIATGIVLDGKVVYSKCAGLENITTKSPITSRSRFNIASNGKQFTALAILKLESEGQLSLKDDIRKYFPELFGKIQSPITIEQLLTHTSGIRDVYGLWSLQGKTWWKFEFGNGDAMELLLTQEDLNFAPGTEHLYSNSNYILLAELVAKSGGCSFTEYTDAMFRQLGMPDTSFESDHSSIRGPIANPYFNFQTWTGYQWLPDLVGDGCLFSTLDDQLHWECLVQGKGETGLDRTLIKKSQQLVNADLCTTYGFGLEFRSEDGVKTRFHAGGTGAWKAYALRYPDRKFTVVTLSNSGKTDTSMQSRQMVSVFVKPGINSSSFPTEPRQIGPKVEVDQILGSYFTDSGFMFRFVLSDGKLYLRRDGRSDVLLERESANVFHEVNDRAFKQEFVLLENGEMQVTAYYNTHAPYSLTRPNNNWTDFDFASLNGTYLNSETGGKFQIEHVKDEQFRITTTKNNTLQAWLASPNKLVSGSYVVTWPGKLNQSTALLLSTSRLRNVKFSRTGSTD